jgi:hypothetical protein
LGPATVVPVFEERDSERAELPVLDDESAEAPSAHAVAVPPKAAAPTPSAIAKPPTRPTKRDAFMEDPPCRKNLS